MIKYRAEKRELKTEEEIRLYNCSITELVTSISGSKTIYRVTSL